MTIPTQPPAREHIIEALINGAFVGMTPVAKDATSTEFVSAVLTIAARALHHIITIKDPPSRAHNIEVVRTAIGQLYLLLPPLTNVN